MRPDNYIQTTVGTRTIHSNEVKKLEKGMYGQIFPTLNSSQWWSSSILPFGTPNCLSWEAEVCWKRENLFQFGNLRQPSHKNCKPGLKVRKRHVRPEIPYSELFSMVEQQYLAFRYHKLSLMGRNIET